MRENSVWSWLFLLLKPWSELVWEGELELVEASPETIWQRADERHLPVDLDLHNVSDMLCRGGW